MTLQAGGSLGDDFAVVDATINVEGGILGDSARAVDSEVNISGGTVGDDFLALFGAEVNISGGILGDNFIAVNSELNISGGTIGDNLAAFSSVLNISGGTVGSELAVGGEVNISGGTVGDNFRLGSGSEVNILGSEFFIDGLELETLLLGESFTVTDRDVTLSGLLADGEQFSFDLNSLDPLDVGDFFSSGATLTVTLTSPVPEPSSAALIGLVVAMGFSRRRR